MFQLGLQSSVWLGKYLWLGPWNRACFNTQHIKDLKTVIKLRKLFQNFQKAFDLAHQRKGQIRLILDCPVCSLRIFTCYIVYFKLNLLKYCIKKNKINSSYLILLGIFVWNSILSPCIQIMNGFHVIFCWLHVFHRVKNVCSFHLI